MSVCINCVARVCGMKPEELVGNSPSDKNWRGIVIALLVILVVCALIVGAVILVTPKNERLEMGESFTFDDMFNPEFKPRLFMAQWVGEREEFVYRNSEGELVVRSALDENRTTIIMDNSTFRHLESEVYFVSEDLNFILLAYDIEPVFRHSFLANYKIYNRLAVDGSERLLDFPKSDNNEWVGVKLQYAGFSPKGNSLTFVHGNNLYYQANPFAIPVKMTNSGLDKVVYNGISDWLYEEEILSSTVAHWWSPESGFICFAEIDDSGVPEYRFPVYGDGDSYYGNIESIPYPKAGSPGKDITPVIKLFVVETNSPGGEQKPIIAPVEFSDQEHYVTNVMWKDENYLLITWSNRVQNKSLVCVCEVADKIKCKVSLDEQKHHGWVTLTQPWFIDNNSYIILLSQRGHTGHWKHIAKMTTSNDRKAIPVFLTQGEYDVTDIVAVDLAEKYVYFISTGGDSRRRHLYRVRADTDTDSVLSHSECLSCDYDEDCQFVRASFSHSTKYYIMGCHGPAIPYFVLRSTIRNQPLDVILEDNQDLRNRLAKMYLPVKRYFEIELDSVEGPYIVRAEMYVPQILREDHITQYPLLIHTYGGPGSQKVTEEFQIGWMTYMVSTHNVIYASIDGRGSGGRGDEWMYKVYQRLGTVEIEDQLGAIKYLQRNLRFVDNNRTAIWGWSYGGFVTSHVMADEDHIVPCGIAVAPVSDWRYYDTAYTERYMKFSSTSDNYKGYDGANVSSKAANMKDKHFMIVHGTADDNVHYQHSAHLIKALTEAQVDFRTQIYTDKNHLISGRKTSRHLYQTMTNFLRKECWDGGEPRDVRTEDLQDKIFFEKMT